MKTLILYASKTGTTEKCAEILRDKIKDATIQDLSLKQIDPSPYDLIIIGGSIRMGQLHKEVRKYLKNYKDILLNKKVAYFICSIEIDKIEPYFEQIDKSLLNKAITYDSFGGELDLEKQSGLDKLVIKIISKQKEQINTGILENRIDQFISKLMKDE